MPRIFSNTGNNNKLQSRKVKAKPAWSEYLTEDNKFALSTDEIVRRRQTLLSKHNIYGGILINVYIYINTCKHAL
jgi:hypothetical protein